MSICAYSHRCVTTHAQSNKLHFDYDLYLLCIKRRTFFLSSSHFDENESNFLLCDAVFNRLFSLFLSLSWYFEWIRLNHQFIVTTKNLAAIDFDWMQTFHIQMKMISSLFDENFVFSRVLWYRFFLPSKSWMWNSSKTKTNVISTGWTQRSIEHNLDCAFDFWIYFSFKEISSRQTMSTYLIFLTAVTFPCSPKFSYRIKLSVVVTLPCNSSQGRIE